ncbi:MAG: RNA polymerase sigma factor [Bacteroidales bacterium]|nr:RNA polymerase sigma factor [Bacteroidales bacterium]
MKNDEYLSYKDEEIIDLITIENKTELFQLLYDRYHSKVLDKCYSLLKDKLLANEFVQDIFSKVYEKLDSFRGVSSFSSWLYAITYNQCIEYLRVKKKLHYPEWNRNSILPEIIDEQNEDFTNIRYERLIKILDIIHPEEKALLQMKYKDNLSVKLIQSVLKISESAVKMRLKRAKARVIYLYKKLYHDEDDL